MVILIPRNLLKRIKKLKSRRKHRLRNLLVARKRPTARRQKQRNATRIKLIAARKTVSLSAEKVSSVLSARLMMLS